MKKLAFLIVLIQILLCWSVILGADNVLSKLKDIDNKMYQGTIEWEEIVNFVDKPVKLTQTMSYDNEGRYKKETIQNGIKTMDKYFDGKDCFYFSSLNNDILFSDNVTDKKHTQSLTSISTVPSFCYGRGLSLLKDLTLNDSEDIVTGYRSGESKVVAYLDKNMDYLAYKIDIFNKNSKVFETIKNTKPILVDNEHYVFSESQILLSGNPINVKISSITFNKPKDVDYLLDWKTSELNISDSRNDGTFVFHDRKNIPKDITSEKLLELSNKERERQAQMGFDTSRQLNNSDNNAKNSILISLSIFVILLILFVLIKNVKQANDTKKNEKR